MKVSKETLVPEGHPPKRRIVEEVDEAIRILESGDVPECLRRCEGIVAEIRRIGFLVV